MANVTENDNDVQIGTATPRLTVSAKFRRNLPAELTARRQWVAYRLETRPGQPKPAKVPYKTAEDRASATEPADWLGYADAVALAERGGFNGIGYVFAADDEYAGIDLDGARDKTTGTVEPWAQEIVNAFASYAEISPSGTGLHILVRGTLPDGKALKTKQVEVYDRERYFTITGETLPGRTAIAAAPSLGEFVAKRRPAGTSPDSAPVSAPRLADLTDEAVRARIEASKDGAAFHRLYVAGETRPGRSDSENDFELASIFARHLGGDIERIKTLMRGSEIADRDKWKRKDYLDRTVRAALRQVGGHQAPTQAPQKRPWLTFAELLALPSLPWLIEGLLPAEGVGVLVGNRGTYKSLLLLDWLAAVASGAPDWFGMPVKKYGPAVYIYAEGRSGIGQRVQAVALARHLDKLPLVVFPSAVNITDPRAIEQFSEQIDTALGGTVPAMIGIDTLARNMPGKNENLQVDMGAAIGGCDALRERFSCLVQLVHHENRSGGIRGSTVLDGAVDTQLNFERTEKCEARLTDEKQKDGEDGHAWTVRLRPEANSLVVASVDATTAPAKSTVRAPKDPLLNPNTGGKVFRALAKAGQALSYGGWHHASEVGKGAFTTSKNALLDRELVWQDPKTELYQLTAAGITVAMEQGWSKTPF